MKNLVLSKVADPKSPNVGKTFISGVKGFFGGICFRSLPSQDDMRGSFRVKWYRTEQELKCDMRYRTGGSVKAELVGSDVRLYITFDLIEKKVGGEMKYFVAPDAQYVQIEEYAATQDEPMKGDIITKYSFEKEDGSFEEAKTSDNLTIVGSLKTGERTIVMGESDGYRIGRDGVVLGAEYLPLFRSVRIIDPKEDEVYERKSYTERAQQRIMSAQNQNFSQGNDADKINDGFGSYKEEEVTAGSASKDNGENPPF